MTIRAQSIGDPLPELAPITNTLSNIPAPSDKPCIGAILDGYPIAGHQLLDGRLIVLEKDVGAVDVPVDARFHGTAMASLVLHGDLNAPGVPQARKLAVVPVLTKVRDKESTPTDKLPVGMIYRAIKTLIAGTEDGAIKPEQIVVINHSICNRYAPFAGRPSPWAALLDHFSHKHNMLFVVSAGNIEEGMPLRTDHIDVEEFLEEDPLVRTVAVMQATQKSRYLRSLLTPAESVNGLTVGALHIDHSGAVPSPHYDPYPEHEMAALYSASGPGINRSIKPDLVEAGGRCIGSLYEGRDGPAISARGIAHVGQRTAAPDPYTGEVNLTSLSFGTSNAAALVTRTALQLADVVEPVYEQDDESWCTRRTRAVILKALIAHSCRWGDIATVLNTVFAPAGARKRSKRGASISCFLGYGRPDPARVASGNDNRITLLADDEIAHDKLHEYRIPIPKAILTSKEIRRIVITLAWSSPVSVDHADYRGMTLALANKDGKAEIWNRVKRTTKTLSQPDSYASARGTLTHVILEGDTRTTFNDKDGLFIGVQARATRKKFQKEISVPYALAVTIELASNARSTTVYEEVSEAIRLRERERQQDRSKVRT
ncbi:S8 family peptidase (plasmid) [Chromobacterium amazonense]|nr:S8 family peptidase [Chromobacterium amazonense]MDE1713566.1 S8 family peptidase [Chromobacterium amazonense]